VSMAHTVPEWHRADHPRIGGPVGGGGDRRRVSWSRPWW
jgi:hypothetical protein